MGTEMTRRQAMGAVGAGLAGAALAGAGDEARAQGGMGVAGAQGAMYQPMKKFNVTVERFELSSKDGAKPGESERFVLPVDCPDAEHAVSATLSNLIAWTHKVEGGKVLPIAFRCVAVAER